MSGPEAPGLMSTLVENARYIGDASSNEKPSACQLECVPQQSALVACVESIRGSGDTSCMAAAVQQWSKCCADANMAEKG